MTKQGEIEYARKVIQNGDDWLYRKPWGNPILESSRHFRNFANLTKILSLPNNAKVLDVGCGPGWLSIFLGKSGYRVTGIDISPDMVSIAKKRAALEDVLVQFLIHDVENSFNFDKDFDAIVIYDVLHHCLAFKKVLENCYYALVDGGKLLLVEPNWLHNISPRARKAAKKYDVTEMGFTRRELKKVLKRIGYTSVTNYFEGTTIYSESLREMLKIIAEVIICRFAAFPQKAVWLLAKK